MRKLMDEELDELNRTIISMCAAANESMGNLKEFFVKKTNEYEKRAYDIAESVKRSKAEAEARCVKLLALCQPVARDLRRIKSALSVIVDLSRVAEQAWHISELSLAYNDYNVHARMLEVTSEMVACACESYLSANLELAKKVEQKDDVADEIYADIKRDLFKIMKDRNADGEDWMLDCLLASKYLERIADHAVKIASAVVELA